MAVRHFYNFGAGSGSAITDTVGSINGILYSGCNRAVVDGHKVAFTPLGGDSNTNTFLIPKGVLGSQFALRFKFKLLGFNDLGYFQSLCTYHNGVDPNKGISLWSGSEQTEGRFAFYYRLASNQFVQVISDIQVDLNLWFDVVVGLDSNNIFISVNNESIKKEYLGCTVGHSKDMVGGTGHQIFLVGHSQPMYVEYLAVADSLEDLSFFADPEKDTTVFPRIHPAAIISTLPASLTRGFR